MLAGRLSSETTCYCCSCSSAASSTVITIEGAWFDGSVGLVPLVAMVAYAVIVGFIAIRAFRWE